MAEEPTTFDPRKYLTKVSGASYLAVKWRLLWLRTEHPDAAIETEMMSFDGDTAVFRARVSLPDGATATGWGSEQQRDFADFVEKAETKALGRALAAVGYGTQFCSDFDNAATRPRVSTPVRKPDITPVELPVQGSGADRATPEQLQCITDLARKYQISDEKLAEQAQHVFGSNLTSLNRRDASTLINRLQQRRQPIVSGVPA